MGRRLEQIPIAFDQFINALFGGWATETISAAAWRKREQGRGWAFLRQLIDCLFFFDENHCETSFKAKVQGKNEPPEYNDERKNHDE